MFGWITRWLPARNKVRSAPARWSARLRLQLLESRETPANNEWLNYSNVYSNPANWSDGVPTSDDVLIFRPRLVPNAATLENPNPPPTPVCTGTTFPTSGASVFAGIVIEAWYSGTITFPVSIGFGGYYQDTGTTVQAADTVLVAANSFAWTGGTINYSANAATYTLLGVSAGGIGLDTTTLYSGSQFVLEATSTVGSAVRQSGVVEVLNDGAVHVGDGCHFEQRQIVAQIGNNPACKAGIKINGETSTKMGTFDYVVVDGGTFSVLTGGTTVPGKVPGSDWGITVIHGGQLVILNGETVTVTHGVEINDGFLSTDASAALSQTATITGRLRVEQGEIDLGRFTATQTSTYSTLKVMDQVILKSGVFNADLNHSDTTKNDAIDTDANFMCYTTFNISPFRGNAAKDTAWSILRSEDGFVDGDDPTNLDTAEFDMRRSVSEKLLYMIKK